MFFATATAAKHFFSCRLYFVIHILTLSSQLFFWYCSSLLLMVKTNLQCMMPASSMYMVLSSARYFGSASSHYSSYNSIVTQAWALTALEFTVPCDIWNDALSLACQTNVMFQDILLQKHNSISSNTLCLSLWQLPLDCQSLDNIFLELVHDLFATNFERFIQVLLGSSADQCNFRIWLWIVHCTCFISVSSLWHEKIV